MQPKLAEGCGGKNWQICEKIAEKYANFAALNQ
jgi:hypothetical protein